jgi:NAD(P)-dependent dehydrogenase (short-subunit alcohol dehydrogenase family)
MPILGFGVFQIKGRKMSDKNEGKVLLITGAGRGMGTDIAKAALAAGYKTVATGRNIEKVTEAVGGLFGLHIFAPFLKQCRRSGLPSDPVKVGHRTEPQRLLKQLRSSFRNSPGFPVPANSRDVSNKAHSTL